MQGQSSSPGTRRKSAISPVSAAHLNQGSCSNDQDVLSDQIALISQSCNDMCVDPSRLYPEVEESDPINDRFNVRQAARPARFSLRTVYPDEQL